MTAEAKRDLLDIYDYVAANDVAGKADDLLDNLEGKCDSLGHHPGKGHVPPELERVGVDIYKEIHFKPYRIIYEIQSAKVLIYAILDGRRDVQSFLQRRLLR